MEEQEKLNQELSQDTMVETPLPEQECTKEATPPAESCPHTSSRCKSCDLVHWIIDGVLVVAVAVLFVLHFTGMKDEPTPAAVNAKPGSGEIVYVNMDSIQKNYEMVKILTDAIDADKEKQTVLFQNRQKALETKYTNFQQNYQSGQLTQKQAEYAQMSIQQESEQLQSDYQQAVDGLQSRYSAALLQVADSLNTACKRINAKRNASFIFSYQTGGQLLYADPTKDVTTTVLKDLNKSFKANSKKTKTSK